VGPGESEAHSDAITVLDQVVDRQPQVGCGGGEHGEEVLNALLALDADEEVREIVADEIRRDEVYTERGKLAVVHSPKDLAQQISVRSHTAERATNKNAGTAR